MFSKIVLALDGSEPSDRVIPVAKDLAAPGSARIDIVHVRELIVGRAGGQTARANEDELEVRVRAQAKALSDAGYDTHLHIETTVGGGPAHVIAALADKIGADVIVVGTRGHTPVAGLLLGSVTQRLLHIARCPVLAIPPQYERSAAREGGKAVAAAG
jgi:nucleotide-binding universal stress UspA family protein